MRHTSKIYFFITACALALGSCTYKIEKGSSSYPKLNPSKKLVDEASFGGVYNTVFRPRCIACHDGSGGRINLESYGEAKQNLEKINQAALIKRIMPKAPYPALTEDELMTLAAWIVAGGPELPNNGNPPPPPPEPLKPEFESIKANIFEVKCLSCHSAGGNAAQIPLATREDLINSPREIVIPGNPEESGLVLDLQEGAIKKMPPLNSNISPVKPEEIIIIEEWIKNGAKE